MTTGTAAEPTAAESMATESTATESTVTSGGAVFLARLESLRDTMEMPARAPVAMLAVATRCRIGAGTEALAAMPAAERLHVLKLLVSAMAPSAALASLARATIFDASGHYRRAEPEMSERMLAVWSGATPEAAGWGDLTEVDRIVCITRLCAAGYPTAGDFEAFAASLPTDVDREALVVAWCRERTFTTDAAAAEAWVRLVSRPMARLEAMASLLARGQASREVASEWIGDAEVAWKSAPRDNLGRALADARFSAVLSAAGDLASAEGLLGHALAGAESENDPRERARIYRIALEAAAGLAIHDARGSAVEPWLRAVEKLTNDRTLLRHRELFFEARADAVRTLRRAALSGGDSAVDRGHQVLKEMCRRLPERWLDLLHWATIAHLQARSRRSTELMMSTLGDALRKEGLPRPIPAVTLDEIAKLLLPAEAERVLAIGDKITHPVQRALWWASAAPFA